MDLAQQVERRVLPSPTQNVDKYKVGRNVTARLQQTEQRISNLEKQIASLKGRPVRPAPSDTISPGDKERLSELIDRTKFRRAVLEAIRPELERIENQLEQLKIETASLNQHTHTYSGSHGHSYRNVESLIGKYRFDPDPFDLSHKHPVLCENCLVALSKEAPKPEFQTGGPNMPTN
jgi:hypothetical protein